MSTNNEIKDQKINDINVSTPQSNSNHMTADQEEDLQVQILQKYRDFQQETGCTNEELFDLVMDIETAEYTDEPIDIEKILKSNYGAHDYWDNTYAESKKPFEWYIQWSDVEPKVSQFVKNKDLALIIGCGNSNMSYEVQQKDVKMVVSIDFSKIVIDQMTEKYKGNENLLWYEMDCTDMSFKDDLFDVVLDKGTFDAIFCGFDRSLKILSSLSEIWRVLKNNGFFIEISFGQPKDRLIWFEKSGENWKIYDPIVMPLKDLPDILIYVLQKIDNEDNKIES
ncbi:hypothetical protein M9Y10_010197 [Tritrichomonas musculus]|uniref:Methyltransferase type 11 domain-containing protein n=1 Tax=Tritrichomonas musculus TaxID=1915356 RepID=A0ABR2IQL5_9EUKA